MAPRKASKSKTLSKSVLKTAQEKFIRAYERAPTPIQGMKLRPIYQRRAVQTASGRALEIINFPKGKRSTLMKLTQTLLNLQGLDIVIFLSRNASLTQKFNFLPGNQLQIKKTLEEMSTILDGTEKLEQYFKTLGEVLKQNSPLQNI